MAEALFSIDGPPRPDRSDGPDATAAEAPGWGFDAMLDVGRIDLEGWLDAAWKRELPAVVRGWFESRLGLTVIGY